MPHLLIECKIHVVVCQDLQGTFRDPHFLLKIITSGKLKLASKGRRFDNIIMIQEESQCALAKSKHRSSKNASNDGTLAELTASVCKGTASKGTAWNRGVNSVIAEKKCSLGII
jgi:hypothetical protein